MNNQGSGALRKAMYMPAVTLMKSKAEHALTRFRDRLLNEGKSKICVVSADAQTLSNRPQPPAAASS